MTKTIHLFRHGLTDWNAARRMQGHTYIPLNEEGRRQALALQEFFLNNPVEKIFSSDLARAQQTAVIANDHLQAPVHLDAAFREVFLGEIEGLTHEEITRRYGEDTWTRWTSVNGADFDFSFSNGETANQAIQRFRLALERYCAQESFTTAAVCTHGFIIRKLVHSLRPDLLESIPIPNCAVFTLYWNQEKGLFWQTTKP